ncbi:arginine-ornithine antiporter [Gephyromycinifex aptenodytis]|uniref:arginine-ornithine antiporter n=1 Tax=Gephyromycinifex aptenodytis TaxID=2716227 RepID=UPI001447FACF|nr:arginine-ornithine antiporter [Gephyromycinifex aptenodytis]
MPTAARHARSASSDPDQGPGAGLPFAALTALVVGSMIGGGIFSLPAQMGAVAAPGPVLIGWLITGVGMLMLAFVFQTLATKRPMIDGGVYGYARAGFGNVVGFSSAWGYWVSAWVGNVAYFVLLFGTLGFFFPQFGEGTTPLAILCGSVLLWAYTALVLRGVREAALLNAVVTVAKIVPIVLFVVLTAIAFKLEVFTADFWGRMTRIEGASLGSTMDQIKGTMLVTVWVFIGIEGASIFSKRAAKRSDVGRATVLGFLAVLALLVFVNLVSYGVMAQADLAGLAEPSMAGVLQSVVGGWSGLLISIGLIVSVLGALLSWTLLCAEILLRPAKDGVMPAWMGKENRRGAPVGAVLATSACIQGMLLWTLVNEGTYTSLIYLASALVLLPYLLAAAYQVLTAICDRGTGEQLTTKDLVVGILALIYAAWLVYAAGLAYVLIGCLFYLVGGLFYAWARIERGRPVLRGAEYLVAALIVLGSVFAVLGFMNGAISI